MHKPKRNVNGLVGALVLAAGVASPALSTPKAPVVVNVSQYGARPDSGEDAMAAIQQAVATAAKSPSGAILSFPKGRYDLFPEHATRAVYHVSNTAPEAVDPTKTIGILLKNIQNLTIEGNGSLLMYHGKMTSLVLDGCENVTVQNIQLDFSRPTVSEMQVVAIDGDTLDVKIHPDSTYELIDGKLSWTGGGIKPDAKAAQEYDPESDKTWRSWNPITSAKSITEIKPFQLRLTYDNPPKTKVGHIFQLRNTTRDEVGTLVLQCRDIKFLHVGIHFAHGLGVISQFSRNVTFDHLEFAPRPETGRTCAGFADFLQFMGCRGKISVLDSNFSGAQDDAINVHGMHLQIQAQPAANQILVRFMHPESWGYDAFFPEDEIDFVNPKTLVPYATQTVTAVERKNGREILLTLTKDAPPGIVLHSDCVENATWTPSVEIRNCRFARVPTRGILVSTRQPVVIENNVFWRTPMSAVLIADDAHSWYESGMARDILIHSNQFVECGNPVVNIAPENSDIDVNNPVHRNIRVEQNEFEMSGGTALSAKSTQGLTFTRNRFLGPGWSKETITAAVRTTACSDVKIDDNSSAAR